MFTVEDVATTETGKVRKKYVLLARDAFNGCELWRRPLKEWDKEKLGPVKVIPVQLQRLLVAVGDRVYCADGYDGPVTVFDGATGAVLSVFENSGNTREFAHAGGVIFSIQGDPFAYRVYPKTKVEDIEITDVMLRARDAESGKVLWQTTVKGGRDGYIGGTLSCHGERLCYMTRSMLFCRNSKTGKELWRRDYPYFADMPRKGAKLLTYHTSPPTILMTDERLFVTELDLVRAYSLADGAMLWEGKTLCNYCKNGDLFYVDGLVWTGLLEGLDPATGDVRRELEQKRIGPMCHPRCYRNRITHKYYINSMTGGTDLLALDGGAEFPSPWMRATCGLAVTPSYGRLYSSPYVCACEIGTMLLGFNCTYNQSRDKGKVMAVQPEPRLVKGPAFGSVISHQSSDISEESWPTYRHDNARSGMTRASIPEQLKVAWETKLPGPPTAAVVAGGLLLTAVRNRHTVYALDSRTGARKWRFTADGPVDSPPTLHHGLALFGCRSGWVYCVDAATGKLVWKFSDMPAARLICDREQLESAWPVNGSVMVKDGLVYFAAGRSSFLDGGIVVYALDPATGTVKHRRTMAGPYGKDGFPVVQRDSQFRCEGFKSGIFSSDGDALYIRQQGFKSDLSPIDPYQTRKEHLLASTGFLCDSPQHRTYWTIDTDLRYGPAKGFDTDGPHGDVIAVDGDIYYEVRGLSPGRHTRNDDPFQMYRVISGQKLPAGKRGRKTGNTGGGTVPRMGGWGTWARRWTTHIPMAGHAILLGGDRVAVAGVPMRAGFSLQEIEDAYEGRKDGLLWTLSAADGTPMGEFGLPAPPVWDGLAAAGGRLYLTLKDGTVLCLGAADKKTPPPVSTLAQEWDVSPARQSPRRPAKPVTLYKDGFEGRKPGDVQPGVVGADKEKGAHVFVTDAPAASGRHCLAFHDAAGLERSWMPMFQKSFQGGDQWSAGNVTLSFDVRVNAEEPGRLSVMLRDHTQNPWRSSVTVSVLPDGAIDVNGKRVKARNGVWHHVALSFELGDGGKKRINATITNSGGLNESRVVPFRDREFSTLTWLGISAGGELRGVVYVDNIELRVE